MKWRGIALPRWFKLSGLVYFIVIAYYEYVCYAVLPWTWPSTGILETLYPRFHAHDSPVTNEGSRKVLRILLVADPQIQGVQNEPPGVIGMITRWDADRYLEKTFYRAAQYTDPHLIIYLGDLLDEGSTTTGDDHSHYATRFHRIFSRHHAKVVYVPGDNDVGGEGAEIVSDENIDRFRSSFRSDALGFWDEAVQFIEVSGLTEQVVLSEPSHRKRPLIVVGHMPFLMLYPDRKTVEAVDELKPALIFSAHNHKASMTSRSLSDGRLSRSSSVTPDFSIFDLLTNPVSVQEVVVPTCSYRMGVPEMGYGFALVDLTTNRLFYTVLWTPSRYPHLFVELCATVAFVVILVVGFVRQRCCQQHVRKVRFHV